MSFLEEQEVLDSEPMQKRRPRGSQLHPGETFGLLVSFVGATTDDDEDVGPLTCSVSRFLHCTHHSAKDNI